MHQHHEKKAKRKKKHKSVSLYIHNRPKYTLITSDSCVSASRLYHQVAALYIPKDKLRRRYWPKYAWAFGWFTHGKIGEGYIYSGTMLFVYHKDRPTSVSARLCYASAACPLPPFLTPPGHEA